MDEKVKLIQVYVKQHKWFPDYPTNIYLFKLNNRNTRKRCEIFSTLTIETRE